MASGPELVPESILNTGGAAPRPIRGSIMSQTGTHILRGTLQDEPAIYREIEIESQRSLAALAKAIVEAFDFDFDHAFGF
jgi:hypothetical protein